MVEIAAKSIRVWSTAFVTLSIATLGLGLAQRAAADLFDKKTVVTFSAPVEIPGKVLTPELTYSNCWTRPQTGTLSKSTTKTKSNSMRLFWRFRITV